MRMWTNLAVITLLLGLVGSFGQVSATEGSDERCRCVCPKVSTIFPNLNDTSSRTVYVKNGTNTQQCSCLFVVNEILKKEKRQALTDVETFCLRCSCKHEKRSSTTQKVVIIIILATMGALFVYGLFLMLLDPLLNKRSRKYATQVDDLMSSAVELSADETVSSHSRPRSVVTSVVNRVQQSQAKWKGQVQEQRANIFSRHAMLN